ncbi:MAG: hypothetical protein HZA50_09315 [Planctomycetes bacterium]|nr:hypothetical protein [Planctomycetota bacterium]
MIQMENRFVILQHAGYGQEHYDLMLSLGEALATWQLAEPPRDANAGKAINCRRLADHRLEYLQYEGPVSGGRGSVTRIDEGEFQTLNRQDDKWVFQASGRLLNGCYELALSAAGQADEWVFRKMSE